MSELEAILPTFIDEQAVQNYLASVLDRTTITEEEN